MPLESLELHWMGLSGRIVARRRKVDEVTLAAAVREGEAAASAACAPRRAGLGRTTEINHECEMLLLRAG